MCLLLEPLAQCRWDTEEEDTEGSPPASYPEEAEEEGCPAVAVEERAEEVEEACPLLPSLGPLWAPPAQPALLPPAKLRQLSASPSPLLLEESRRSPLRPELSSGTAASGCWGRPGPRAP